MDGRRLRKWWLSGCLVAGAFGCNRNSVQQPQVPGPVLGTPVTTSKPFWGGSGKQNVPTEIVEEPARKGPAKPETIVALANAQLDSALDEKTIPASREALLDQARQGYQKALQQDSKNKAALLGLAKYYARVGDREKAVEAYKKYFAVFPKDKEIAHEVALAHAQWKDWGGAVSWCEYALKLDPENLSCRKTMAFCLARAGKWERGFEVMCEIMPEAQARYLMARVLEHQNQPEASRMQLQLAIKADPNYAPARDFLDSEPEPHSHRRRDRA
jgi:tetratricopeptide (TPR) repeat protein